MLLESEYQSPLYKTRLFCCYHVMHSTELNNRGMSLCAPTPRHLDSPSRLILTHPCTLLLHSRNNLSPNHAIGRGGIWIAIVHHRHDYDYHVSSLLIDNTQMMTCGYANDVQWGRRVIIPTGYTYRCRPDWLALLLAPRDMLDEQPCPYHHGRSCGYMLNPPTGPYPRQTP